MKKVVYVITSLSHKRVFESFEERNDLNQMIIGPYPIKTSGLVPEDYSDFKIKNIKFYKNRSELQTVINSFDPDIYAEASLPIAKNIRIPKKCKKVYVSHGMIGNHVKSIIGQAGLNTSVWKGCDLYCGATNVFADWVKHVARVKDDKILLNAIPQFDILNDHKYFENYKDIVLNKFKTKPNKVVLFAGFCCRDRHDFKCHNEDYFKTAIELERLAKKYNWLVMVKPRQEHSVMLKFLRSKAWGSKYIQNYESLQKSKFVHFITTTGHIYRYFFADAFVINGRSTIEVEAAAIGKPLFIVKTGCDRIDAYDSIGSGIGIDIRDISEIDHCLVEYFTKGNYHWPEKQKKWFVERCITLDGEMHKRIQDRIVRL